ncbi:MAG: hypothetical protein QXU32_09965 [Nitrososphaerales archaeon]
MPELWLKYGSTEVVLDIKAENLLDYVTETEQHASDAQVNAILDTVPVNGNTQITILDPSLQIAKLSLLLSDNIKKRGIQQITIYAPTSIMSMYRSIFQDRNVQVSKLPDDLDNLNGKILLSKTSFDPLFGYAGAATSLLRYFGKEKMLDAYKARAGDLPKCGVLNNALSMAHKFSDLDTTCIEAVMGAHGFADIIVGKPAETHMKAISKLEEIGKVEVEKTKAAIISSGNGYSTLSYAMNALWNCLDSVKDDSSLTLLAECKDGFGSEALQMFVEGKISLEDAYKPAEYIEGLENILYLSEVGKKYDLALVSTLPDYYVKNRLGLKTFRRMKDVLHNILNVYGTRQKVLVVADASKVMLKPKMPN